MSATHIDSEDGLFRFSLLPAASRSGASSTAVSMRATLRTPWQKVETEPPAVAAGSVVAWSPLHLGRQLVAVSNTGMSVWTFHFNPRNPHAVSWEPPATTTFTVDHRTPTAVAVLRDDGAYESGSPRVAVAWQSGALSVFTGGREESRLPAAASAFVTSSALSAQVHPDDVVTSIASLADELRPTSSDGTSETVLFLGTATGALIAVRYRSSPLRCEYLPFVEVRDNSGLRTIHAVWMPPAAVRSAVAGVSVDWLAGRDAVLIAVTSSGGRNLVVLFDLTVGAYRDVDIVGGTIDGVPRVLPTGDVEESSRADGLYVATFGADWSRDVLALRRQIAVDE